jgi:dipeptidyl-peptidase-4
MFRVIALTLLLLLQQLSHHEPEQKVLSYHYKKYDVEGWTVFVQKELDKKDDLREPVLDLLRVNLRQIANRLPVPVVKRLREVEVRMHLNRDGCPGGVYHPSSVWLKEHDLPENWGRGIEFGNARNFLSWARQQPAMVLHELSHAWHHQVLGNNRSDIIQALDDLKKAGSLDEVLYVTGGTQRAYALNNQMEFFAEMSEAWWATNDMYPFVRGEIMDAFPGVAAMMEACWRLPK